MRWLTIVDLCTKGIEHLEIRGHHLRLNVV